MAIRVLGPFEVEGLENRRLGGPQQRAVLALLALRPNEAVRSERLIQEIWGDDAAPNAKKTLQVYVSGLRRALADRDEKITTVGGAYRLDVEAADIDAVRFEALIGEAESTDPIEQLPLLDEAIALWRGPPFTGLPDAEPLLIEARRLEELRLHAMEMQLAAELRSSDPNGVIGRLHAMVDEHPLRERLSALLMEALYRSGRQAEALRTFSRLRAVLADELGIEPGPEVQELELRILQQDASLLDAPTTHAAGSVIRGYELLEEIGSGAFGLVFRARQTAIGREVALKIVRPELASQPEFIRRFEVEAQIVASLDHPNIVPLYDFWRDASGAYMAMRISDGSLDDLERPRPLGEVLDLVDQIASALAFAHANGVVHCDLKPENVLLESGRAFLSDFGIAALTATTGGADAPSSSSYAAPEVRQDPSPQSDVFGLAALTVDLLGGGLEESVASVIERGTARDPAARHGSPLEFASELRAAAERETPRGFEHPVVNPYRGLVAFQESEADVFFGRSAMVEALVDQVRRSRFTAVVGPSGSGKSSVVRAGLIPAVRREEPGWLVVDMVPGRYPFDELARALDRVAARPAPGLAARLLESPGSVVSTVRALLPAGGQLVLVIDQFEELFTLLTDDVERDLFLELVAAASLDPDSPIRLVTTLRADFYAHPLGHPTVGELFQDEIVPVAPMSPEDLEQAIVRPARTVGVDVELGLVAQLVADVVDRPGGLPLMQFALTELFENRDGQTLTLQRYRQLGGLADALGARAEAEYRRLTSGERSVAKGVFLRLVTIGEHDTRRRTSLDELEDAWDAVSVRRVLDGFDRARLLSFDHDPITRIPTVEVAHEALFTAWGRLSEWVEDSRDAVRSQRRLAHASAEWEESGHDESFLLRGRQLAEVEGLASDDALPLTSIESRFLHASLARRDTTRLAEEEDLERERRINRRLRISIVGVVALAVLLGISGLLAFNASRQATEERDAAYFAQLISRSTDLQTTQTDLALLLAAEAYAQNPGFESQRALLGALQNVEGTIEVWEAPLFPEGASFGACFNIIGPGQFITQPNSFSRNAPDPGGGIVDIDVARRTVHRIETSPLLCDVYRSPRNGSDSWLYVGTDNIETTIVIDSDGTEVGSYPGFTGPFFDRDGRLLAKSGAGDTGEYVELDPQTGEVLSDPLFTANRATVTNGGAFISVIFDRMEGPVPDPSALLDADTYEVVVDLSGETGRAISGRASADDSRFGYVSKDDRLLVWDTGLGDLVLDVPVEEQAEAIAFSPDGSSILLLVGSGMLQIRSGETGQVIRSIDVSREPVMAIDWIGEDRIAVLRTIGVVDIIATEGGGLHETGPPCCERNEFGFMVADGIPNAYAVYGNLDSGVNTYVDVDTGESIEVDVSEWVFGEGGADLHMTADKTTVLMRPPFEIFRVDLDGVAEEPRYPFEGPFLFDDEVPDHLPVGYGSDEFLYMKVTEGSVDDVRREMVVGELEVGVIDIGTMEPVVEPYRIDLRDESPEVTGVGLLPGGIIYAIQAIDDDEFRHQYFAADGERLFEFSLPFDTGWWQLTPDRRYLLTANALNDEVRRWDIETGESIVLPVFSEPMPPIFLSDGRFMILTRSGQFELWDVESGAAIGALADVGPRAFIDPAVHPDESHVWVRVDGSFVKIPLDPQQWLELACELAGRSLTDAEWRELVGGDRPYRDACETPS